MGDLKPCPFCGARGIAHRVPTGWRVSCTSCDCQPRGGFPPDTEAKAIAVWNTRPAPTGEPLDKYAALGAAYAADNPDTPQEWVDAAKDAAQRVFDSTAPTGEPVALKDLFINFAADFYGIGTPECRGILTAVEHMTAIEAWENANG